MYVRNLKRVLSLRDVFFIAVGQIIGAGVIVMTGIAIGMTGPGIILAYFGSAVLVLLISLLFMMGGSAIPSTGAFYVWPSRLINGWTGSIVIGLLLLSAIALSLYGIAFGEYLHPVFPGVSKYMWGIIVVTVFYGANLLGLKMASGVQMVLVIILISALAIYAGFAIPEVKTENLTPMFPNGASGFITAIALLIFATGGAMLIVMLGGEIKDPHRNIPRAVILSTISVTVLYAFVAIASVGVIPWKEMVNKPLTVAGKAFLPGWAFTYFLVAGAGLAICTTLNSQYIQYPRNFLVACWDGVLPQWMGRLNRFGAPHHILTLLYIIGVVPLLLELRVDVIARAASIAAYLPQAFQFWALSRLPHKVPDKYEAALFKIDRKWIMPLFVLSELSVAVGIVFLAYDLTITVLVVLLAWCTLSIVYYPVRRRYMLKRGIDIERNTSDLSIFETEEENVGKIVKESIGSV